MEAIKRQVLTFPWLCFKIRIICDDSKVALQFVPVINKISFSSTSLKMD